MSEDWMLVRVSEFTDKDTEIARLRAEVERLTGRVKFLEAAKNVYRASRNMWADMAGDLTKELEGLRRVSDGNHAMAACVWDTGSDGDRVMVTGGHVGRALVAGMDRSLDPRLGTQQPEGEPVAPMSGRQWRYLP